MRYAYNTRIIGLLSLYVPCCLLVVLPRDARNVVVVHCLDGRSTTALVICALLIYSALVQERISF